MRIGVFVTGAICDSDRLDHVSGHVQIPLMAAKILSDAGHQMTLMTTRMVERAECLLDILPAEVEVCVVEHATLSVRPHRIHKMKAVKQAWQLLALIKDRGFDVVHFFGGACTGWLLCTLKSMGIRSSAFYSPIKPPSLSRWGMHRRASRLAFRRVSGVLAFCKYVSEGWAPVVDYERVRTLYPGIVKELPVSLDQTCRDSVLFWRYATPANGIDVAMEAFRRLAPQFPNVRFVLAVLCDSRDKDGLRRLGREAANIDVHFYPYESGVSLVYLLSRALVAVHPFRSLSINPQMAILETLYAGVPVIATAIESNAEVVCDGVNGLLIAPDDEASLASAIERLLKDVDLQEKMARNARAVAKSRWNWDSFGRELLQAYTELG